MTTTQSNGDWFDIVADRIEAGQRGLPNYWCDADDQRVSGVLTPGQLVRVIDMEPTATYLGPVIDFDEHMLALRWNDNGAITHEYPRDVTSLV